MAVVVVVVAAALDRKSTRLNSSHDQISYAVFCLKNKIVYCTKKKTAEDVADVLKSKVIPATFYHAGMKKKEREDCQNKFISCFFFLMIGRPPRSTLFPNTTLFR